MRLTEYDYNTCGAYFVTICTQDRRWIFWENGVNLGSESQSDAEGTSKTAEVGAIIDRPQKWELSYCGQIADKAINYIPMVYPEVKVDNYVIMPNHIHLLLTIQNDNGGRSMIAPTVSRVVKQLKGYISKQLGESVFQRSYYDHIIREMNDYLAFWQYIDENPAKWELDEYHNPIT